MRRAEWRRLPQDPRTPLGWWNQEARRALSYALFFALMFAILIGAAAMTSGSVPGFALVMAAAAFGSNFAIRSYHRRSSPNLALLAPSPAPVEAFPVEFTLLYDGIVTGRDRGVASMVDGWLHIEGLRTAFSLRTVDVARVKATADEMEAFELPGGQRIELRPLGTAQDRATFGETVRVWHRFSFESPVGEPLLPPLRVHGTAVVKPLTNLFFLALPGVGILAFLFWITFDPSFVGALFPIFLTFICSIPAGTKAVRHLRALPAIDRLGLEAEERETLISRHKA